VAVDRKSRVEQDSLKLQKMHFPLATRSYTTNGVLPISNKVETRVRIVGFKVLTPVVMKNFTIF
jgi:hypothetical protein